MTTSDQSAWIQTLHPKRQKEFFALGDEEQALVLSRGDRTRRSALRALDQRRRGINGRERWVTGLELLGEFLQNSTSIFKLAFAGKIDEVEAMMDILIDFQAGEHENTKNTDPSIYDLMHKAAMKMEAHGYQNVDFLQMAEHFKKHPELRPLVGRYPDAQQIAQKKALQIGAKIKARRKRVKITQEELASSLGTCPKTVKNMEAGKPVSSHTLLMAQNLLAKEEAGHRPSSSFVPKVR